MAGLTGGLQKRLIPKALIRGEAALLGRHSGAEIGEVLQALPHLPVLVRALEHIEGVRGLYQLGNGLEFPVIPLPGCLVQPIHNFGLGGPLRRLLAIAPLSLFLGLLGVQSFDGLRGGQDGAEQVGEHIMFLNVFQRLPPEPAGNGQVLQFQVLPVIILENVKLL